MNYILDTDITSYLINQKSPMHHTIVKKIQHFSPSQIHISVFTKCELYFGLGRIDKRKQEYISSLTNAINMFVTRINILDISPEFPEVYGIIRAELVNKGQDIGVIDCMIAAQAITQNFTLITHNTKHYQRIQKINTIPTLKVLDWLQN